jgi:catechol 2,3-dioxygenase-like lactoylglutathione lyase family enzyme
MPRLDHLSLPVRDWRESRDWYKSHLGFEVEFEIPDRKTAAMRDDADLTIFLYEVGSRRLPGHLVNDPGRRCRGEARRAGHRRCALCSSADEGVLGLRRRVVRPGWLSAEAVGSEIDAREGRWIVRQTRWSILLGLLASLVAAACADSGASSDNDRRGGFYAGISGGGTWP